MAQLQKCAFLAHDTTHARAGSSIDHFGRPESVKSGLHSSRPPTLPPAITIAALSCVIGGAIIFPFFRRLDSKANEDDTRAPHPSGLWPQLASSNLKRKGSARYTATLSRSLALENVNWNDDLHADSRTHNSLWTSSSCIPGVIMPVSRGIDRSIDRYVDACMRFGKQKRGMIYSRWWPTSTMLLF